MALYRLHKDTWEKTLPSAHAVLASMRKKTGEAVSYPGGGRKGISSGLGTVVRGGGTGGKREKVAGAGGGGGSVEADGGGGAGGGNWWEDE
jgi:RNA exonuclease 4